MNIAFKEWAVVCAALASGRQTIILRKGGIDEGREGFRVKHQQFWLLPTRFHQDASLLTPDAEPLWRETLQNQPPPGEFRVDLAAIVQEVIEVHDLATLEKLASQHILSRETIEQRFHYRRPGLFVLIARIYRASEPFVVRDSPYIAGCKSWVELPQQYSGEQSTPVLDEAEFLERMRTIRALVT